MGPDGVQQAIVDDLDETGLPWLSAAVGRARPELLEDALFLVFPENERYAFFRAREWRREVVAALRSIDPDLNLRIHRQADRELFGL
ncbi:MAG: hypothetical protein ACR2NA_00445 [Solirubrobacterales bacterium]